MKRAYKSLLRIAAALTLSVASLSAFDPITDGSGIYVVVWERGTIPVQNNLPNSVSLSDGTTFQSSVDAAIEDWNTVIGNVQFNSAHGTTGSYAVGNEINEFVLDSNIDGFDFGDSTLAVTVSFTDGGNTRIESDIIFNDRWDWDSYRGDLRSEQDVRRVAIHELGHVLGLDHPDQATPSQNVAAVMNSVVSDTDRLLSDDIDGGQFLYGAPDSTPPNDDFATAITVVLDTTGRASLTGSNVQSSSEPGEPVLDQGAPGGRSVWWKWTAVVNGVVEVSTVGSRFDTVLGVFSGTQVDELTGLGVADDIDAGIVRTSRLSFLALGGETYYFMVDGWDGLEGAITLGVELLEAPAPLVSISEERIIAPLGESLTLTVSAQPVVAGELSYQWRKDNQLLVGETEATLVLSDITNEDAGAYTVEVSESGGGAEFVTAFVLPKFSGSSVSLWSRNEIRDTNPAASEVSDVIAVAAGGTHALALRENGTVVGWIRENLSGAFDMGQEDPPVGLHSVVAIAAGLSHSIALKADGTVVTWGGRINSPALVPSDLKNVVAISAGHDNSAALLADGSVVLWDYRTGFATRNTLPRNVVAVEMLGNRGFTLHHDGRIKYWNDGFLEELNRPDLPLARSFSAGPDTVLSLGFDGRVYQAAVQNGVRMTVPDSVQDVTMVEAGGVVAYGIKADGTITSWLDGEVGPNLIELLPEELSNVVRFDVDDFGIALSTGEASVPPTIIGVSADVSLVEDDLLVVSARVGGDGPFSFQWRRDGIAVENDARIAGAGTARLAIRNTDSADTGNYSLVVTNGVGETTSQSIRVDVAPRGSFVTVPLSQLAVEGQTVELTAAFNGFGEVVYQWFHNESPLQGETNATLTLSNVSLPAAGRYALRARDNRGSVWTQCELLVAASDAIAVTWAGDWAGINYPAASVPATSQPVAKVSIGEHGLVLLANGEVLNLRRFASANTDLPAGLSGVVDIAVGAEFAVALLGDGSVMAWGKNNLGQTDVPADLGRVIAIEASHDYAMALRSDGTLVSWGNPAVVDLIPTGQNGIIEFSAWSAQGVVLHRDRSVSSWGNAQRPPDELDDVVELSVGPSEAAVLLKDGTLQSWPLNGSGLPFDTLDALESVRNFHQGLSGGIAVKNDGTVTRWNFQGAIVDDVPQEVSNAVGGVVGDFYAAILRAPIPAFVTTPPATESMSGDELLIPLNWTGVGAPLVEWFRNGEKVELSSRISIDPDGSLRITEAMGEDSGTYRVTITNAAGSVTSPEFTVTVRIRPTLSRVLTNRHVTAGDEIELDATALETGVTYTWFRNGEILEGQTDGILRFQEITREDAGRYAVTVTSLEGGRLEYAMELVVVDPDLTVRTWGGHPAGFDEVPAALTDVVQFSSKAGHALALSRDGAVLSWGDNLEGQTDLPRAFEDPVEVSAGNQFSMVLEANGSVTVWGDDRFGKTTVPASLPPVKEISAGRWIAAALTVEGEVYVWGLYYGTGDEPLDIPEAIGIKAGLNHNLLVLLADGSVRDFYQGNDLTGFRVPEDLTGVVEMAAASSSHLVLKSNDVLEQWSFGPGALPSPPSLSDVAEISATGAHALALKTDGSVVAWGDDSLGQSSVPSDLPLAQAVQASNRASFALVPFPENRLAIVEQPRSLDPTGGSSASLRVRGRSGMGPLSYQWFRDGVPLTDDGNISGVNTPELSIVFASELVDGSYTVELSDDAETVSSLPALLRTQVFGDLAEFTVRPTSRLVRQGEAVSFGAEVEGAMGYTWLHKGSPLEGVFGSSLTIEEVGLEHEGYYEIRVVGEGGRQSSSVFHVQVIPARVELVASFLDSGFTPPDDSGQVAGIHVGHNQAFVLRSDGTVEGWGTNTSGAIDAAADLADVVYFDVSHSDFAAILSDGTPVTSNAIWNSKLADLMIDDAVGAAAGSNHVLIMRANGSVIRVNEFASDQSAPPSSLLPVIGLDSTGSASLGLQQDGTLVYWGSSIGGAVDDIPNDLAGVIDIGMGFRFGVALLNDDSLRLWGWAHDLPDFPSDFGPVVDFDVSFYGLGVIDRFGVARAYGTTEPLTIPDDWTSMKRIAVGSGITLGLRGIGRPVIVSPPMAVVTSRGSDVVFRVEATGIGELSYQWTRNRVNLIDGAGISGAQTSELTIQSAGAEDFGEYSVTIVDDEGTAISDPVSLQFELPLILEQPQHRGIPAGQSVTLSVEAGSPTPLSYQWYRGRSGQTSFPIPGATGAALSLAAGAVSGEVWVRVQNDHGSVDSSTSSLLTFAAQSSPLGAGPPGFSAHENGEFIIGDPDGVAFSSDLAEWQVENISSAYAKMIYGLGLYIRPDVSTATALYYSEDGSSWGRTGYASGSTIKDIAFNGSRFVAVSDVAGYSDDGINWTTSSSFNAVSVVWGGDRFVAVGYDSIRVSTDGITWEPGRSPGLIDFRHVIYGDGRFVASSVGSSGTALWSSINGYDWEMAAPPTAAGFYASEIKLTFGDGLFVGVPSATRLRFYPRIYLSTDGQHWSESFAGFDQATDVVFGNGRFLVTDYDAQIFVSAPLPSSVEIEQITPSGFVAGGNETELTVSVSDPSASVQWYRGPSGDDSSPVEGGNSSTLAVTVDETSQFWVRVVNAVSGRDSATVTLTVAEPPEFVEHPEAAEALRGDEVTLQAVVSANPEAAYQWYVGLAGDTSQPLSDATSADLSLSVGEGQESYWVRAANLAGSVDSESVTVTSWNQLNNWEDLRVFSELDGGLTGIAYTGVLRSQRGVSWQFDQPASFPAIRAVAYGPERYVALTQYGSGLRVSADLLTWTELIPPVGFESGDLFDVVYAWDAFWVCTGKANQVLRSENGLTWEVISLGSEVSNVSISAWHFDGQRLIGIGGDAISQSVAIVHSLDGENWQRVDLSGQVSSGESFRALEFIDRAHGRFYAWENTFGLMLTSLDGEVWSKLDRVNAGLDQIRPVGFGELDRYTVTADAGGIRASLDGLSWSEISSHEAHGLRPHGMISLPGRLLVEGDGGIWETTDLVHWVLRARHPSRSGSFRDIAVGEGTYVTSVFGRDDAVSYDGKTWSPMTDPITPTGSGGEIAFGDGRFLAARPNLLGGYWHSVDGSNWTDGLIESFPDAINEFVFLNDRWFALGVNGVFAHSQDGLSWTIGSVPGATGFHYAMAYGNGRYVTSADRRIWWSVDLITWTEGPELEVTAFALTHAYDRFVLAGARNDGQILTSADGESWQQAFVMSNNGMYDLAFDGSRVFAATADGILVSEDAIDWRWTHLPAAVRITSQSGLTAAAGNSVLVRSANGPRAVAFRQQLRAGPAAQGRTLTISADVIGDSTSMQWFRDGIALSDGPRVTGTNTQLLVIGSITQADAGRYKLVVNGSDGIPNSQSVEIVVTTAPEIVTAPVGDTLTPEDELTLSVDATGGDLNYQWLRDGEIIVGATERSLQISSVGLLDGGRYQVLVYNSSGEVLTDFAFVSVLPVGISLTGTQSASTERYVPGGTLVVTQRVSWEGATDIDGLGLSVLIPEGWSMVSSDAVSPDAAPSTGDEDLLEWSWQPAPLSPFEHSFVLRAPTDAQVAAEITTIASIFIGSEPAQSLLSPDPLLISPALHSADTDQDFAINLSELLRVIELYNTRSGTSRTGRYTDDVSSADGFAPDVSGGATTTKFHSADTDRDSAINLSELLRVIELYNTRAGTSRTGAYRIDETTTDGFAPDS